MRTLKGGGEAAGCQAGFRIVTYSKGELLKARYTFSNYDQGPSKDELIRARYTLIYVAKMSRSAKSEEVRFVHLFIISHAANIPNCSSFIQAV
jgi:hypothetical protein